MLGFPAFGLLLEVGCGEDTFSSDRVGLVHFSPSSQSTQLIIIGGDRHPKGSNAMSQLDETIAK